LGEESMPILAKFNAYFAQFLSGRKEASLAGVLFGSFVQRMPLRRCRGRWIYSRQPDHWPKWQLICIICCWL
ncbi:hypothetical protein N9X90_08535, partial [Alphaproteobacteria bacterium]|nr:hypothetical protein [Alphaproteobacteria bacterium]